MSMGLIHGGARSPSLISDRVLSERPQLLALWGRFGDQSVLTRQWQVSNCGEYPCDPQVQRVYLGEAE